MTDKISIKRIYRTKNGQDVRLFTTDGPGDYPVFGAYFDGTWIPNAWSCDGEDCDGYEGLCLIEYDGYVVGYLKSSTFGKFYDQMILAFLISLSIYGLLAIIYDIITA